MTPVPIGGGMLIHESNMKETAPMLIAKITIKHIDLVCICGRQGCNLKLRLRLEKSGGHPTLESQG